MNILFESQEKGIRVDASGSMDFPPHLHSEIEIILVTEGTITLVHEEQHHQLQKGQVAVIFPNCIHEYRHEGDGKMALFLIKPQIIAEFANTFTNKQPVEFIIQADQIEAQLLSIYAYFLGQSITQSEILDRAYLHLLLALITEKLTLINRQQPLAPSLLFQIITFVSQEFTHPISLQQVADELGCSPYTVSRVFSKKIKIGFSNYINQMRVDYARKLLRETELSILAISLQAGFESLRSFNRVYLNIYNETPSHYRKRF